MNQGQTASVTRDVDSTALSVRGPMTFATVAALWQQASTMLQATPAASIDLAGVTESDSAGLALVLALLAEGRARQPACTVANVPADLHALARVSDADHWLETAA